MPESVTIRTSDGRHTFTAPSSIHEVTVEVYQNVMREWDNEDWLQLFCLLCNVKIDGIADTAAKGLASNLFRVIEFWLYPKEGEILDEIPIPKGLDLKALWSKDALEQDFPTKKVKLPKNISDLSIAQLIQARKSLEGLKDMREGLSMITAIYLQPLLDAGRVHPLTGKPVGFNMANAIEYEQTILKMRITLIYPIGFFLLRKLPDFGMKRISVWSRILNYLLMKKDNY